MQLDTTRRPAANSRPRRRAPLVATLATSLAAATAVALGASPAAQANTWPTPAFTAPGTVTADVLPTPQINGVVWAQEIVGNTVYVGGNFTSARPFGSPVGQNENPRNHFLAYDLTTGALLPVNLPANAQVRTLEKSPDGTRLYIGGDFTSFGGVTRSRIAAINTATNTLAPFAPSVGWHVYDISTTDSTVYVGGNFTNVGASVRDRLAAFTTAGALLSWAPTGVEREVTSVEVSPDGSKVAIAGKFETLNGSTTFGRGLAFVDAVTGATMPLAASSVIRNGGPDGGITSLHSDGDLLYGTGFTFGRTAGTLEGVFAAEWGDGTLRWVNDCHGDSYSVTTQADVIYSAGHAHYCGNIGGFGQPDTWEYYRGVAHSKAVAGIVATERLGYTNFAGLPRPELLNFFPTFNAGTFTGQSQGPWSVSSDGRYVVYGGEFTNVNGTQQQGLVRFQRRGFAPNAQGPNLFNTTYPVKVQSLGAGSVTVTFQANRDRDDAALTYRVFRRPSGGAGDGTVRHLRTATAPYWGVRPVMTFTDTGPDVVGGTAYEYRVQATDGNGNFANSPWVTVTVSTTGSISPYLTEVLASQPDALWTFDESPGATVAADLTGWRPATVPATGVTFGQPGATGGTAAQFNGATGTFVRSTVHELPPHDMSLEAWFRAPAGANGGLIAGFNNSNTANAGAGSTAALDRHLYMDTSGRVHFGVNPTNVVTATSQRDYRDNEWHHVVGSVGPDGLALYVDGVLVARDAAVQWGRTGYYGFVRIGGGALNGYPGTNTTTGRWFDGQIDDVALYKGALGGDEVRDHYAASGRTAQVPADPYGTAVHGEAPSFYWRLGETAPATTAVDTGPQGRNGTYVGGVALGTTGAIQGTTNTAATFNGTNARVNTQTSGAAPQVFSAELWFRTTSATGGKLLGFGDQTGTANSNAYDRHLYLQNDGRLVFGTSAPTATNATQRDPAQQQTIVSTQSYNLGGWHHVVATMGTDGMKLYVDGTLVGSHPATSARAYTGFWRVGGDPVWSGATSGFFNGSIDDVAVYPAVLDVDAVAEHYTLGSNDVPNVPPIANFSATVDPLGGLDASFVATTSLDPDGTIASYRWNFGDGSPEVTLGTPTTSHRYAVGTYTATLTVTDDDGATDTRTATVVVPGPNVAPTAAFTSSIVGRDVTFDASGSTDTNGTIVSYRWNFGDGTPEVTAGTSTTQHTYATAGTRTVTLTVTDDRGATGVLTRSVSANDLAVAPPPPASVLAVDGFGRTVANGWGTADTGGAWTITGSTANYAVDGSAATMRMAAAASGPIARLQSVSAINTDTTVDVAYDKPATGGGLYFTTVGRRVGTSEYRATARLQANGTVQALVVRRLGSTDTNLAVLNAVPGLTVAPGQATSVRFEVTGTNPTTLRMKVWATGTAEPVGWSLTATDAEASLQAAGSIGVNTYVSGSATNAPIVATIDNLRSVDPLAPTTAPPTARFAVATSGLTADLDAAISVDDGTIASWSWEFGDGATSSSGPAASRTFAAPGTYAVRLVVTDDQGLTGETTLNVSVG